MSLELPLDLELILNYKLRPDHEYTLCVKHKLLPGLLSSDIEYKLVVVYKLHSLLVCGVVILCFPNMAVDVAVDAVAVGMDEVDTMGVEALEPWGTTAVASATITRGAAEHRGSFWV